MKKQCSGGRLTLNVGELTAPGAYLIIYLNYNIQVLHEKIFFRTAIFHREKILYSYLYKLGSESQIKMITIIGLEKPILYTLAAYCTVVYRSLVLNYIG